MSSLWCKRGKARTRAPGRRVVSRRQLQCALLDTTRAKEAGDKPASGPPKAGHRRDGYTRCERKVVTLRACAPPRVGLAGASKWGVKVSLCQKAWRRHAGAATSSHAMLTRAREATHGPHLSSAEVRETPHLSSRQRRRYGRTTGAKACANAVQLARHARARRACLRRAGHHRSAAGTQKATREKMECIYHSAKRRRHRLGMARRGAHAWLRPGGRNRVVSSRRALPWGRLSCRLRRARPPACTAAARNAGATHRHRQPRRGGGCRRRASAALAVLPSRQSDFPARRSRRRARCCRRRCRARCMAQTRSKCKAAAPPLCCVCAHRSQRLRLTPKSL